MLVDFHAEATSEKVAMGWHLDGRVTACVGTHTHVPTADARVLPGGTAYITDVGHDRRARRRDRRGPRARAAALPDADAGQARHGARDDPWLMGVLVEAGEDGRAKSIEQLLVPAQ